LSIRASSQLDFWRSTVNLIKSLLRVSALTTVAFGFVSFTYGQGQPQTPPASGQPGSQQPGSQQPGNQQQGKVQQGSGQQGMPQMGQSGGITQAPWFNNPQVRQQLNLNEEQFKGLNSAYQQVYNNYQQGVNGLDKTLSDAQRQQRMNDLQQNFYKDFSTATDKYLTDPTARQRYNQLYWQYRGYGAFTYPPIAEALKLTPEQRNRFAQHQQNWNMQMSKLTPIYQNENDRQHAVTQFGKLQSDINDQINSILTPEQQTQWRQMAGTAYTFPPETYFGSSTTSSSPK